MDDQPLGNGERLAERHAQTAAAYRKQRRGEIAKRFGVVIASVILVSILGTVLYTVTQIRRQQVSSVRVVHSTSVTAHQVKAILDQLQSCIDPKGKCAQRGQQATVAAIGSINEVQVYAAACSPPPVPVLTPAQRLAIIRPCITQLLKENR